MEVSINGDIVASRQLARTPHGKVDTMSFQVDLHRGANELRIEFGHWHRPENDRRNLALALNGIGRL